MKISTNRLKLGVILIYLSFFQTKRNAKMNPLTNMRNIKKLSEQELERLPKSSWHDEYKSSAWIFVGGLPYDLSEGDVMAIFSQYGEIVNLNLVRDKDTGKQKGFCFICYEDQRSTVLAVDNFNSTRVLGRMLRVDHVKDYKPPKNTEPTAHVKDEKMVDDYDEANVKREIKQEIRTPDIKREVLTPKTKREICTPEIKREICTPEIKREMCTPEIIRSPKSDESDSNVKKKKSKDKDKKREKRSRSKERRRSRENYNNYKHHRDRSQEKDKTKRHRSREPDKSKKRSSNDRSREDTKRESRTELPKRRNSRNRSGDRSKHHKSSKENGSRKSVEECYDNIKRYRKDESYQKKYKK